ncbi:MAG: class I SAM-dependent methyltransferase [Solirubrobacterales bacterium]
MDRRLFAHIQARASATEERRGGAERRRQLLAGLSGRVVEVGAGSGVSFAYYPAAVRELAVEPERILPERGLEAAERAPVPVEVVDGVAERLPLPDASVDAVVWPASFAAFPTPAARWTRPRRSCEPTASFASTSMSSPATVAWRRCSACSTRPSGHASSAAATRAATPRRHSSPRGSPSTRASAGRFARPTWRRPSPPASSGARREAAQPGT